MIILDNLDEESREFVKEFYKRLYESQVELGDEFQLDYDELFKLYEE